jgi:hypothetical protein
MSCIPCNRIFMRYERYLCVNNGRRQHPHLPQSVESGVDSIEAERGVNTGRVLVGERRFKVWLWSPHRPLKLRGIHTANLIIGPSVIRVRPTALGRVFGLLPAVVYEYPTVVIEHVHPAKMLKTFGSSAVLLEIQGRLGSAHVRSSDLQRLRSELRDAGFVIREETIAGVAERPIKLQRRGLDLDPALPTCFFE